MNKHRIIAVLTAFLLLCMIPFPPLQASALSGKLGENITWSISKGVLTLSGTGKTDSYKKLKSPLITETKQVYHTVIIEEGITEIGDYTRIGRFSVTSVSFPESLKKIGIEAFRYYSGTELTLPPHLETIGDNAFEGMNSVEELVLPESVTKIGINAFSVCNKLRSVVIPNDDAVVRSGAFSHCSSLESVRLPEHLTEIPDRLFMNCNMLHEIRFPPQITRIGANAFFGTALTEIDIPESVRVIGEAAFSNSALKKVTLHDGLEKLGDEVFLFTLLAEILLPDSVSYIGARCFPEADGTCERLKLPENPDLVLAENALPERWLLDQKGFLIISGILYQYRDFDPPDEIIVPDGVRIIYPDAFIFRQPASVILPDTVTELRGHVFSECGVKTVRIPPETTQIAKDAIYKCSSLEAVEGELYSGAHTFAAEAGLPFRPLQDELPARAEAAVPESDILSFTNSSAFFGERYSMTAEAEQLLIANAADQSMMQNKIHKEWTGSCFGMSTVSVLLRTGILPLSLLDPEAKTLHDIRPTAQAISIINYYQNLQETSEFLMNLAQTSAHTQFTVLSQAARYADEYNSGGAPCVIGYLTKTGSQHAVVGNGLSAGTWTFDGRSYDRCIRIWDSNYSGMNDGCCLYFNHLTLDYLIPNYGIGPNQINSKAVGSLCFIRRDTALLNHQPYPSEKISGDFNGDRKCSIADAVLLARYTAEDSVPLQVFPVLSGADLNADGSIDLQDVFVLLNQLLSA